MCLCVVLVWCLDIVCVGFVWCLGSAYCMVVVLRDLFIQVDLLVVFVMVFQQCTLVTVCVISLVFGQCACRCDWFAHCEYGWDWFDVWSVCG